MNGIEFLAWVAAGAIIFGVTAAIFIFRMTCRENKKAVEEFKKRRNLG
ncbi:MULTISPECIES: hypothetical protein [unclassified Acinetobacter]|nr:MULTISPECIES: hypothetical protein [unclassified Acinetobacter]MDM1764580.1 hypothetical protein [Acinetobacter sp. 226-1]MDM1769373.1 hypothetical protein [Acinetobacter sp. 226-4]MDM1769791.1 hypothetical protein [Acinetobacter sp. 226-4]